MQVRDHRILDVDCVRLAKGKVFAVIGPNGSEEHTLKGSITDAET